MENFRSKSCAEGRTDHDGAVVGPISSGNYSASYAAAQPPPPPAATEMGSNVVKFKKGKSTNGSVSKSWSLGDPEMQRKKRVASYKVYTVEGKVKGSLRKSFRWLKDRYSRVVYGWW